jgi:GNAT superfamily N-acetyltransferase
MYRFCFDDQPSPGNPDLDQIGAQRPPKPVPNCGDTVATSGLFRAAFARRRCLGPADAFYEWQKRPDGTKEPHAIAREDGEVMAFAGLWEGWNAPDGETVRTFAIITTAAKAEMAALHDRMPVNGCTTYPVAFLEGIYVDPDWRKRGIARLLCRAVEYWATDLGCSELASDTDLKNTDSQRMHTALDFEETERIVFYRKQLPSPHR